MVTVAWLLGLLVTVAWLLELLVTVAWLMLPGHHDYWLLGLLVTVAWLLGLLVTVAWLLELLVTVAWLMLPGHHDYWLLGLLVTVLHFALLILGSTIYNYSIIDDRNDTNQVVLIIYSTVLLIVHEYFHIIEYYLVLLKFKVS